MIHENHTHHASSSLTVSESIDRHGQIVALKGQGFKHGSIYEQINTDRRQRIWIESPDRSVMFTAKKQHMLDQVRYLRDTAFPDCTLCVWEGGDDGHFVLVDRPKGVSVSRMAHAPSTPHSQGSRPSKGKAKRRSCRIKRTS